MVRWLLLSMAVFVAGCSPAAADALPQPTPQPTRPTLALPTHPVAESALPRIQSSFDLPPPSRTPFAVRVTQGGLPPSAGEATPTADATPSGTPGALVGEATPTPPAATPTLAPTARPSPTPHAAHRFAVSTRARSYYYCDTDSAWKGLSTANLRWYETERALKAAYPGLTLHEPCR